MSETKWLKQLYDEHASMLYRLAARKLRAGLGHALDAEDVIQEVFLLALERDIRAHAAPVGWLVRTTELVCLNYIRRNQRRTDQQNIARGLDPGCISNTPEAASIAAMDARQTLHALENQLPREDWMLLKTYSSEETAPSALAREQGISLNTLRVRIHRLRRMLKEHRKTSHRMKGE